MLLLGPRGVGKTHLAVAIGRGAILSGYTVLFTTAAALVASLAKAHLTGRLEEQLLNYTKPKLLIVDELGYLPLEVDAAHLFFQLVNRRYERGGFLVTSNQPVGEWGRVFGDDVVATAILDRLLHHSHVITIRRESYRLRGEAAQRALPGLLRPPLLLRRAHNREPAKGAAMNVPDSSRWPSFRCCRWPSSICRLTDCYLEGGVCGLRRPSAFLPLGAGTAGRSPANRASPLAGTRNRASIP